MLPCRDKTDANVVLMGFNWKHVALCIKYNSVHIPLLTVTPG